MTSMKEHIHEAHHLTWQAVLNEDLYERQPHPLTLDDIRSTLLRLKAETEKALAAVAKAQEVRV